HLYCFAQVSPLPFLGNYIVVNPTGRNVICLGSSDVEKTLVMPQVQIRFSAVIGNIAFAMFIGVQRTRIHIDIGIEFLNCDRKTSGLKKFGQRRGNYTFAQRGCYTARNKYILCGLLLFGSHKTNAVNLITGYKGIKKSYFPTENLSLSTINFFLPRKKWNKLISTLFYSILTWRIFLLRLKGSRQKHLSLYTKTIEMFMMEKQKIHATTVLGVLHNGKVSLGADGQATMGNTVAKSNVHKVRKLQ